MLHSSIEDHRTTRKEPISIGADDLLRPHLAIVLDVKVVVGLERVDLICGKLCTIWTQ